MKASVMTSLLGTLELYFNLNYTEALNKMSSKKKEKMTFSFKTTLFIRTQ